MACRSRAESCEAGNVGIAGSGTGSPSEPPGMVLKVEPLKSCSR